MALLAFGATSCSSSTAGPGAADSDEPVNSGAPSEPSPAQVEMETVDAGVAQPGLLTLSCGAAAIIERRSVDTGEVLASLKIESASVGTGARYHTLCAGNNGPSGTVGRLHARQQLDQDFSHITFTTAEQADGAQHVGVSDLAGTEILDLTELTSSDDFSGTVPVDSTPVFDDAGDVYFLRNKNPGGRTSSNAYDVYKFDMSARTGAIIGTVETQDFIGANAARDLTVQQGRPVLGDFLLSPSAKLVAQPSAGASLFFPAPSGNSVIAVNPLQDGRSLAPGSYYSGQAQTGTHAWLDEKRLLVSAAPDDGGFDLFAVPVRTGKRTEVEEVPLLPSSTRTNFGAVLSPDGDQMSFLSRQGNVTSLYRLPLRTPGQQPTQILSEFTGSLLSWDGANTDVMEPTTETDPVSTETAQGRLQIEGQPIPNVSISAVAADGTSFRDVTDEAGNWRIMLPAAGIYSVTLDPLTLPPGIRIREGRSPTIELPVAEGQQRPVLFPLGRG